MANEISIRLGAAVPSSLQFPERLRAIEGKRVMVKIPSNVAEVETGKTSKFTITIPNSGAFWDGRDSRLCFDLSAVGTAIKGNWSLNKSINSIFSQVTIRVGTTIIVQYDRYNLLSNILLELSSTDEYSKKSGEILSNMGDLTERKNNLAHAANPTTASTLVTRRYCMNPLIDFLNNTIPIFSTNSPFSIDFQLAPLNEFLEDAEANAAARPAADAPTGVKLTNVTFHTHILSVDAAVEARMRQSFVDSVKTQSWTGYDYYSQKASGSSTHSVQIPVRRSVISGMVAVMTNTAVSQSIQFKDKLNSKFYNNGLVSYQAVINGQNVPQDQILCSGGDPEGYSELMSFLGKQSLLLSSSSIEDETWNRANLADPDDDTATGPKNHRSQKMMALDLRPYDTSLVSGVSTATNSGNFLLRVNADFSDHDANGGGQFEVFTRYVGLVQYAGGRVIVVT